MDQKLKRQLAARAQIVKSLAHPTRLFIVQTLKQGEQCVCELTDMIGTDISTVSKHLSLLKNAGIVEDERRGNQIFYHLKTPCLLSFLECVETILKELHQNKKEEI